MRATHTALLSALLLAATGCGGGSASAKLKMRNDTGTAAGLFAPKDGPAALAGAAAVTAGDATFVTPTVLGIKLVAVYLAEDVDPVTQNNRGNTSMIWLNDQCAGDIESCGPAPTMGHVVTSFFDFAQGTTAVNVALNAQGRKVDVGTYRYARIEFCKYGPGDQPNLQWQAGTLPSVRGMAFATCGVTSQRFATPLELKDGDAVEVTLAYDLAQAAMEGTPPVNVQGQLVDTAGTPYWFIDCADHDGLRTCINPPTFVPSAQKL
jgi:hypothetical protein